MKKFILLILLFAATAHGAITKIDWTVTEDQGVARTGHPVSMGFPMASDTGITDCTDIIVTDSGETEQDSDCRILQTWTSGGNIRWVDLTFAATVSADSTAVYEVHYGPEVTRGTYTDQVVVTDNTTYFQVDVKNSGGTKIFDFKVSQQDSFKIYDANLGATNMVDSTDVWISEHSLNGTIYNTDHATGTVTVEFDGFEKAIIRCEGNFENSGNTPHFKHVTFITAYANQTMIDVSQTVIFDKDMQNTVNETSWVRMTTPVQFISSNFAAGGESSITSGTLTSSEDAHVTQWYYDNYYIDETGGGIEDNDNTAAGWLDGNNSSHGLTISVPNFSQRAPHKIMVDNLGAADSVFYNYFWPDTLSTYGAAGVAEAVEDLIEPSGNGRILWPLGDDLSLQMRQWTGSAWVENESNAGGVALTWESNYYFHTGTHATASPTSEDFHDAWAKDLLAWNAAHAVSTLAFGKIAAVNVVDYSEFESFFEDGVDRIIEMQGIYKIYGAPFYGIIFYQDWEGTSIGGRSLLRARYAWQRAVWEQFFRTGEIKYYDLAKAATTLLSDTGYFHADLNFTPDAAGTNVDICDGGHGYDENGFAIGSSVISEGESDACDTADKDVFPSSLYWGFYITGSPRWDEVADTVSVLHNNVSTSQGTRGMSGQLDTLLSYAERHNDATYVTKAHTAWDNYWIDGTGNQQKPNGFGDYDGTNPSHDVFLNTWWSGLWYDWFSEYATTPEKAEMAIFTRARAGIWVEDQASNFLYDRIIFGAVYLGYELTADAEFLKVLKWAYPVVEAHWGSDSIITRGLPSPINSQTNLWAAFTLRTIRYMYRDYDLSSVAYPNYPSQWHQIWQAGTSNDTTFYINETSDSTWNFVIQVLANLQDYVAQGDTGNITVNVYDPNDDLVSGFPVVFDMADYCCPDAQQRFDYDLWKDHLVRTYTVPSDSLYGTYRVTITCQEARAASKYPAMHVVDVDNDYAVKFAPDKNGNFHPNSFQRFFFFVPSGSTSFTVTAMEAGYYAFILRPDGTVYSSLGATTVVVDPSGYTNNFWSVTGRNDGQIIGNYATARSFALSGGDSNVEDFVYVSPAGGQFDLGSFEGTGVETSGSGFSTRGVGSK